MPEAKISSRLPSGKHIRSKLIVPMAKQIGKYAEAEQMIDEIKAAADKQLAEEKKKEP